MPEGLINPKMPQTRREFVRTLFSAAAGTAFAGPLLTGLRAESSAELPFLLFGDWGRKGQRDQAAVATQMGLAAAALKARFVASLGDNFYDYGVVSTDDPQWKESFEDVYTAPSLQVPWHVILGNHDYRGNCQAQIDYSARSPRWRMPARYFSRTEAIPGGKSILMVYTDTSPFVTSYAKNELMWPNIRSQDTAAQLEWVDRTLRESKAEWKIVLGHHPIYSSGEHGDTPELIDRFLPLLKRHGVHLYFNGHDHDLQHQEAGGIHFFCVGAGSTVRPIASLHDSIFAKSTPGFAAVSVGEKGVKVRLTAATGEVLHSAVIPGAAV
jgi:acid phosphatase